MGALRATIYTPAVTMVAAWINALTGVGPAIASGSQTYRGIWADFPVAPTSSRRQIAVIHPGLDSTGRALNWLYTFSESGAAKWIGIKKNGSQNAKTPPRF